MTLPIVFDDRASAELNLHLAYLASVNPASAHALSDAIASILDLIADFPELHEKYSGNVRRAVLARWSLGIFYEIMPNVLFVAAIADLRHDPAAIRHRLGLHEAGEDFASEQL